METLTIESAISTLQSVAEQVINDEPQEFPVAASANDTVRQGDVYIVHLARKPKAEMKPVKPTLQLAPGNTQGSRHCLDSLEGVTMYQRGDATEYDGPVMCLSEPRTVTHPEHGDWKLCPGWWAIGYQRTEDSEQRIARVRD